jgi:hypothetical protein
MALRISDSLPIRQRGRGGKGRAERGRERGGGLAGGEGESLCSRPCGNPCGHRCGGRVGHQPEVVLAGRKHGFDRVR